MLTGVKFTLLTHQNEFAKRSNTGRLVKEILGNSAEQLRWERTSPPGKLVEEIEAGGVALIYPGGADGLDNDLTDIRQFIIIDGTWQEARKIYQKSQYLRQARRFCLKAPEKSLYTLRKNQKESGLCTAECVMAILASIGNIAAAEQLQDSFLAFVSSAQQHEKTGIQHAR
jgi:DTW domain-containing protein YfiP